MSNRSVLASTGPIRANKPPANELERVVKVASTVLLGKERVIRMALACLLARGHLLIEDLPGMGKTTLAHLLARLLGMQYSRIQFTSDLLPSDIIGVSIFDRETQSFRFHSGAIFSQLVLADEINRATPKAQSALLEAMEERQITVEGQTRQLPDPFFVIATQNPAFQVGTFPLPESQLDRFLMRIEIGYPEPAHEKQLLAGEDPRDLLSVLEPCLGTGGLLRLQRRVRNIHVADAVVDYCQALLNFSRRSDRFEHGLSPRAGLGILSASRAWALLDERKYVLPEDVQAVLAACVGHRLQGGEDTPVGSHAEIGEYFLESVPIP